MGLAATVGACLTAAAGPRRVSQATLSLSKTERERQREREAAGPRVSEGIAGDTLRDC